MNKRGNSSPSNPSPNSFMRQSERKPSRTRSPRGTVLDHFTGIRLEAFEMCCDWWRTNRTNLLKRDSVVVDFSFTCAFTFKRIHRLTSILLFLLFVFEFPVSGCEAMIPPTNKDLQIFLRLCRGSGNKGYISKTKLRDDAPSALRPAAQLDVLLWEPIGRQGTAYSWQRSEAPLLPSRPRCNFIHPRQVKSFP